MRSRYLLPVFAAGLLAAGPTSAATVLGRVFGLSAALKDQQPSGAGQDVDIDVDLTMVFRRGDGARLGPGQSGSGTLARTTMAAGVGSTAQSVNFGTLNYPAFLGGSFTVSTHTTTSVHFTTSFATAQIFSYSPYPLSSSGTFHYFRGLSGTGHRIHNLVVHGNGGLPGIDWGDGSSAALVKFPVTPLSTTTSSGGAVFRHWRGTFSHSYGDQLPHTVRFASHCCPDSYSLGSGNPVSASGTASFQGSTILDLNSVSATYVRRGTFGFFGTFVPTYTYSGETPFHLTASGLAVRSLYLRVGGISQLTDSVEVPSLGTAIPTVSGVGLGLLAVALLGTGAILLRRA